MREIGISSERHSTGLSGLTQTCTGSRKGLLGPEGQVQNKSSAQGKLSIKEVKNKKLR